MTLTPGGATERPWSFGKFFHCAECEANNENYTWRIHNASGKEIARHGFDESLAALLVAAVNSYDPSPDSKLEAYRKTLEAASGYLLNAKIDLETGCTKATAIKTIEGGLTMIKQALAAGGLRPPSSPQHVGREATILQCADKVESYLGATTESKALGFETAQMLRLFAQAGAPVSARDAVIEQCRNKIGDLRISEAGLFDAKHSGQRGQDRSDALYDACQLLRSLTGVKQ